MKKYFWLGFCILFTIAMRFFSFFPSVINHDESTYIVIANAVSKGYIYFVDFIDTKPFGVFVIIAAMIKLVGNSVFLIRMLSAILIGVTAFFLYLAKKSQNGNAASARAASIIYVFFVSIFTFYGVSLNTELYFNIFTSAAVFLFFRYGQKGLFWVGLLIGAGFVIKYMVALDAFAIGIFIIITSVIKRNLNIKTFISLGLYVLGFVIPFLVYMLYYYQHGHLTELLFYTFYVSSNYSVESKFFDIAKYVLDFHLRFLPIILLAVFALIRNSKEKDNNHTKLFYIIWYVSVMVAVLLPGKSFGHYFIQMMIPLSFIAADFFTEPLFKKQSAKFNFNFLTGLVVILLIGNILLQKKDYFDKTDYPELVANYLDENIEEGEIVYTGSYHQIVNFLLDQESITPYVHRSLLRTKALGHALNINIEQEFNNIKEQKPAYILQEKYIDKNLKDYLQEYYRLDTIFRKDIMIYKLKP